MIRYILFKKRLGFERREKGGRERRQQPMG